MLTKLSTDALRERPPLSGYSLSTISVNSSLIFAFATCSASVTSLTTGA